MRRSSGPTFAARTSLDGSPDWAGLWMIAIKSSDNHAWPWSDSGEAAEAVFAMTYPAIHDHMNHFEAALRKRQDKGQVLVGACDPVATGRTSTRPRSSTRRSSSTRPTRWTSPVSFGNNKTFFIASADPYLLAVLNSPLLWWHNWRHLPHMKDEALSPVGFLMESLPIARPTDHIREKVDAAVRRLVELTCTQQATRRDLLDWLRVEYEVAKPTMKLQSPFELDSEALVAEVRKVRGKKKPLSAPALKGLREEYVRSIEPARAMAVEAARLENEVACLVNEAYGLTPEEVALMWDTAPPRMPVGGPDHYGIES